MAQFLLKTSADRIGNEINMATSMKSKFAGLLRGLLRKMDGSESAPASQPIAASAPPSAQVTASSSPSPGPAPVRPPHATDIELPLVPIIAALPIDLRAKLMPVPLAGLTLHLPLETAMSQLAFGAVKISFGELRELAPGIFANSGGEHDHRPVNLPLAEILTRLNPALLLRPPTQQVKVDAAIVGPFSEQGRGITFTTLPLKPAPVSPPPAASPPALAAIPLRPATLPTPRPSLRVAEPPPAQPLRTMAPAAPKSVSAPVRPAIPAPVVPSPTAAKLSSAPPANPVASSAPTIFVTIGDLCAQWPEVLRHEISSLMLADIRVPLAGTPVEAGLKRGRVMMSWKQLRTLAKPSSPASPNDPLELELPLKAVAPLFFAAQKTMPKAPSKMAVSAEIPDLFFGFPQAVPAAPVVPVSAPVPPPPASPAPKTTETNFYVWGDEGEVPQALESEFERPAVPQTDFSHRQARPQDIVTRSVDLPGVAGAVVSLPDGLCVASQVPEGLNTDALAAFLPQIFERVNQATRELRMGALTHVDFTVGNVPWMIFRVSSVYFAAFGQGGKPLPAAHLAQLAAELERKNQQ